MVPGLMDRELLGYTMRVWMALEIESKGYNPFSDRAIALTNGSREQSEDSIAQGGVPVRAVMGSADGIPYTDTQTHTMLVEQLRENMEAASLDQ